MLLLEEGMPALSHKKIVPLVSLLVAISLLLAACSAPAPVTSPAPTTMAEPPATAAPATVLEPITQENLVGAVWQWTGGRESPSAQPYLVADSEKYTITFSEDGSLFVQADCNTSRGTYELNGSQLSITLGATTLVACEEGSLSDQFMADLAEAASAGSGFGNLVIVLAGDAGEMYFNRSAAPEMVSNLEPVSQEQMVDILWQWTSLEEPPPAPGVGVGDPSLYDIVFRADGTYSAKADCNRLNGSYTLNGSQLTINPGISTLVACDPESRSDQYASLLWRVTGVAQKEGMLVLLVDDGSSAMSFVNAGASPVATPAPVVEGDPASILGPPDGVENFDNANNWTNFTSQCFNSEITGGQFVMTANGVPQFSCWEVSWPQLQNFYLETTQLMPTTCQPDDRFGFLFRAIVPVSTA
jgi:heat shock protein HslJ